MASIFHLIWPTSEGASTAPGGGSQYGNHNRYDDQSQSIQSSGFHILEFHQGTMGTLVIIVIVAGIMLLLCKLCPWARTNCQGPWMPPVHHQGEDWTGYWSRRPSAASLAPAPILNYPRRQSMDLNPNQRERRCSSPEGIRTLIGGRYQRPTSTPIMSRSRVTLA